MASVAPSAKRDSAQPGVWRGLAGHRLSKVDFLTRCVPVLAWPLAWPVQGCVRKFPPVALQSAALGHAGPCWAPRPRCRVFFELRFVTWTPYGPREVRPRRGAMARWPPRAPLKADFDSSRAEIEGGDQSPRARPAGESSGPRSHAASAARSDPQATCHEARPWPPRYTSWGGTGREARGVAVRRSAKWHLP